ncbi:unnamed protein product [Calypogeia fissa]
MAAGMGQGSGSAMLVLVGAVAAVLLLGCPGATAANFVVGGLSQNWNLPTSNNVNFYTSWAAQNVFNVNDTLQFIYNATSHTVLRMPQDSCNTSLATVTPFTDGNTTIPLMTSGTKYYICSIPGHCDAGMKLTIVVGGAASTPLSSPAAAPGTSAAAPRLVGVIGTIAAAAFSAAAFFM